MKIFVNEYEVGPFADLTGADLHGADLHGADLHGASLFKANLAGANLAGANLVDAQLSEANLEEANLEEANLAGAILTYTSLNGWFIAYQYVNGNLRFRADHQTFASLEEAVAHWGAADYPDRLRGQRYMKTCQFLSEMNELGLLLGGKVG